MRRAVAETNGALPSYKRIGAFEVRWRPFPKTATGKIKRGGLAELYADCFGGKES
jgi:hypothetical protein